MQCTERQFGLGLDAHAADHSHLVGGGRGVFEQSGLSDPCLAPDDEHATVTRPCPGQQAVDMRSLALPSHQHDAKA
jgi:hypothetical protein